MAETIYAGVWGETYGATVGGKVHVLQPGSNGELKTVQTLETGSAISKVCSEPNGETVLAIGEVVEGLAKGIGGDVFGFDKGEGGRLTAKGLFSSMGAYPIDVAFMEGFAAVINHGSTSFKVLKTRESESDFPEMYFEYDEASLALFYLHEDGSLGDLADLHVFTGSGEIANFQSSASPHSVYKAPNHNFMAVPLRGTDEVAIFGIDAGAGKLRHVSLIQARKGYGPRNVAFHPSKPIMYLLYEIQPWIDIYEFDANSDFRLVGGLSTLQEELPAEDVSSFDAPHPVDILVHPNGQYLYALTRTTNIISTYSLNQEGMPVLLEVQGTLGGHPRSLVLGEDGLSIYISLLDNESISGFTLIEGLPRDGRIVAEGLGRISCIGK